MDPTSSSSVDRALAWLAGVQAPTGELPAWASPLDVAVPSWTLDPLNFITALAAVALDAIDHPRAAAIVDAAVAFVVCERQQNGLWRYWASTNDQTGFTPADADDTACCSLAASLRGHDPTRNIALLLANRDRAGRFRTWFVPRGRGGLRLRAALWDERSRSVRRERAALWETTEAEPGDVDAVVNANVCRYLGPAAPAAAARWVVDEIRAGNEIGADKWHRNATTLYLSVADGARRGVPEFTDAEGAIVDRIAGAWALGRIEAPLDRAQAALALQAYGAAPAVLGELLDALESTQTREGCWERSVFYYGGPKELFGWGSEALTTAYAAAALARGVRA